MFLIDGKIHYTVREVAKHYNCHVNTARQWCALGHMDSVMMLDRRLIPWDAIQSFRRPAVRRPREPEAEIVI